MAFVGCCCLGGEIFRRQLITSVWCHTYSHINWSVIATHLRKVRKSPAMVQMAVFFLKKSRLKKIYKSTYAHVVETSWVSFGGRGAHK